VVPCAGILKEENRFRVLSDGQVLSSDAVLVEGIAVSHVKLHWSERSPEALRHRGPES
jgi:hypothetical protein